MVNIGTKLIFNAPYRDKKIKSGIFSGTCIAQYESEFKTDAINPSNADGSSDHGIFQVSLAICENIMSWLIFER